MSSPIVWARPAHAAPALYCAVCERGASVVTYCRGRWQPSADDVLAWEPAEDERCGGCARELAEPVHCVQACSCWPACQCSEAMEERRVEAARRRAMGQEERSAVELEELERKLEESK